MPATYRLLVVPSFLQLLQQKQGVSQKPNINDRRSKGVKCTLEGRFTFGLCVQQHQQPRGELPRKAIKQGKNLSLAIAWIDQTWPILYLGWAPCQRQRKPWLAGRVEEVGRTCQLHEHLKEPFFKVLIGGRESLEQDAARPADQRMSADQLRWVGGVEMEETSWEWTHLERSAYHAKGLHGRPRVRMQLNRLHVECLKDTDRERVKRKRHVQVRKQTAKHEEEGGFGR